jgi:hypothetical protein
MLLFVAFGLWMFWEFFFKANIFGELSKVCGPFFVIGGLSYILTSHRNLKKIGAVVGLFGSGLACYMFFTMLEMISNLVFVYPAEVAILALAISILCLLLSFMQLCKTI